MHTGLTQIVGSLHLVRAYGPAGLACISAKSMTLGYSIGNHEIDVQIACVALQMLA
jgi:hypothetical protein